MILVSVLSDANMYKILNIIKTSMKNAGLKTETLTQEQYDELVATGKVKEGIFYMIIDETGG